MPAPNAFDDGSWQPFSNTDPFNTDGSIEILYATGREPATAKDKESFYQKRRTYLGRDEKNLFIKKQNGKSSHGGHPGKGIWYSFIQYI